MAKIFFKKHCTDKIKPFHRPHLTRGPVLGLRAGEVPCFFVGTLGGQSGDMACGFPFRADPPEDAPHCPHSQPPCYPSPCG